MTDTDTKYVNTVTNQNVGGYKGLTSEYIFDKKLKAYM